MTGQRRSRPHHIAQFSKRRHLGRARLASTQMRFDGNLHLNWQFVVVVSRHPASDRTARQPLHTALASRSRTRSASRPRVSRDFTVPTATPSENAISS